VPKPFYASELAARVRAVLKGFSSPERIDPRGRGSVSLDRRSGLAYVRRRRVDLTPREFELLSVLVGRAGRVVRREELVESGRGSDAGRNLRVIDAHVKSIRRKLGEARDCIETVRGIGYRFSDPEADELVALADSH
jgi:DNA-binding response OmpR family regulator